MPPKARSSARANGANEDQDVPIKTANGMIRLTPAEGIELLKSSKWADLELECKDSTFKIHRLILDGVSELLDQEMLRSFTLEYRKYDKAVVSVILWYIYTGRRLLDVKDQLNQNGWLMESREKREEAILFRVAGLAHDSTMTEVVRAIRLQLAERLSVAQVDINYGDRPGGRLDILMDDLIGMIQYNSHAEEMKHFIAWIVISLKEAISEDGPPLLDESEVDSYLKIYGTLGPLLYQQLDVMSKLPPACPVCRRAFHSIHAARRLSVIFENQERLIQCTCGFRGFCSSKCEAVNSRICLDVARCNACGLSDLENQLFKPTEYVFHFDDMEKKIMFRRTRDNLSASPKAEN